jgi:adenylate kinase
MNAQNKGDRSAWFEGSSSGCPQRQFSDGSPRRLVLLGAPGVGKGTQAVLLSQHLGACHLSTGDVFRYAARRDGCSLSPAMKEAIEHMRRGALVPDSTVWNMVVERSACIRCGGGFILDGFPRTVSQATSLERLMRDERMALDAVINYELPVDEIVCRLSGRRTCRACKAIFHVKERPPRSEGACDQCGGELCQRDDDRPESIAVRLDAYREATAPLIDFYRTLGLLVTVSAAGPPETICERTIDALAKRA